MKSFAAVALLAATVAANKYPDCEPDNCHRNLVDDRFKDQAPAICKQWLAGTTTAASAIPTQFNNCPSVQEFSSACSCVTYTATHTSGTPSSSVPPSSSATPSSSVVPSSSIPPVSSSTKGPVSSSSAVPSTTSCPTTVSTETSKPVTQWTTSTICSYVTHTVTECPSTVPNCPVKHTTTSVETIPITTTVCPVTTTPAPHNNGTATYTPPVQGTQPPVVTGAAGRFAVEYLAAAAGVAAALL
ncbi:hypothetical protein VHEMI05707 [[Torrubiella] hemipterigena]|uniref:Uncharacterized protein n=1 Tax=[Torrubiella] hemipterigena TaxID=1531966 RepID=A0A0A1THA5_9HYPO|nr:hypothetical protein VHEMI05707 [[Torrubiella] hemipterigena]